MSYQVHPHLPGHEGLVASIRLALQEIRSRALSSKGKRSQRVHDEVDPEKLQGSQRRITDSESRDQSKRHGNNINCQLELKKF